MTWRTPVAAPLAVAVLAFAASLPSRAAADDKKAEPAAPATLDEGMDRLEKLLGKFDPKNDHHFRFTVDSEDKQQPDPNKPPVLIVTKGTLEYGTPFRLAGAIAFDYIEEVDRSVYDLGEGGKRTLTRNTQRYRTDRVVLRPEETGGWSFQEAFVSHSNPGALDRTYFQGTVKWLDDGVELIGTATDNAYAPEGKLIRAALYGDVAMRRQGPQMVIKEHWDWYHLLRDPQGTELPVPDFKSPFGQPVEVERKSTPPREP